MPETAETHVIAPPDSRGRSFEAVYNAHYAKVWAYVRRRCASAADADDVSAQTWLAIWRRLDDLPEGRELPWCYGTARRCLANHRRGEARRVRLVALVARERVDDAERVPDVRSRLVLQALSTLRDGDQELLGLTAWEGLGVGDVAVVLGVSPSTVSVRLHRAKRRLARAVQELGDGGHTVGTAPEAKPGTSDQ